MTTSIQLEIYNAMVKDIIERATADIEEYKVRIKEYEETLFLIQNEPPSEPDWCIPSLDITLDLPELPVLPDLSEIKPPV